MTAPQVAPSPQQQPYYSGSDTGSVSSSSHAGSAGAPPSQPQPPPALLPVEEAVLVTSTADEETADGVIRNREAIRKIRDTWIYKQVRNRQEEFTQYRQVCTSCLRRSRSSHSFGWA